MVNSLSSDDKISLLESADVVTIDTEGFPSMVGFSVAFDGWPTGLYFPYNHATKNLTSVQQEKVYSVLDTRKALVMHHAQHDLNVLAKNGFHYEGYFYCTMLMAHWINEEQMDYSLNAVSARCGGKPKEMPEQMGLVIGSDGWNAVPVEWMDEYSSNDSFITLKAFNFMLPEFQAQGFDNGLWEREQTFIREVIIPMINYGIKIDPAFCVSEYMRGIGIMEECTKELGFRPSLPSELKKFLIDELGLPVVKHTKACKQCFPEDKRFPKRPVHTHTAKPSFDKEALAQYDEMLSRTGDKRAQTVLRYRGWQKTTSSNYKPYMELADASSILHPSYNLHRTVTRRLSCSDPNLQQIPKTSNNDWNGGLKRAFIARDGFRLWTVDYSQLQFRMTCAYAECHNLLEIFEDEERDIFQEMANNMQWARADVKTMVYLITFGGGGPRASAAFGVSLEHGKSLVEEFHSAYPEIKKIAKEAERAAMRQGYVASWTGQRRHLGPRSNGTAAYKALNAVIQQGEAEIIKDAMILIQREVCDDNCRLVLQIHDEIVSEIKIGKEEHYLPLIQERMIRATDGFNKKVNTPVAFKTSVARWGTK